MEHSMELRKLIFRKVLLMHFQSNSCKHWEHFSVHESHWALSNLILKAKKKEENFRSEWNFNFIFIYSNFVQIFFQYARDMEFEIEKFELFDWLFNDFTFVKVEGEFWFENWGFEVLKVCFSLWYFNFQVKNFWS